MMSILVIIKFLLLVNAIVWTFSWIGRVCRGQGVASIHTWLMGLSVAGFIFLQFKLYM